MKTFAGAIALSVLAALPGFARDDLGSFSDARAAWPDAFVPGKVARVDRADEAFYAFAGAAESFFEGEFAESDAELYEEATLDAKARFYEWMAKGDPSFSVSLSGLRVAYRWADGAMRYVVCVVPQRNVKKPLSTPVASPTAITAGGAPPPPSPPPAPKAESVPASETDAPRTESGGTAGSNVSNADETLVEAKIRVCRERLSKNPDDPFVRLRLARLFAQSGQAARATRHYCALVKRLASDRGAMPAHDAASAMVEAAEHARVTGNEAQALKFYRSAWKLGDPELQPRITAAISLLRLHVD